jgi:hypothetical protein
MRKYVASFPPFVSHTKDVVDDLRCLVTDSRPGRQQNIKHSERELKCLKNNNHRPVRDPPSDRSRSPEAFSRFTQSLLVDQLAIHLWGVNQLTAVIKSIWFEMGIK